MYCFGLKCATRFENNRASSGAPAFVEFGSQDAFNHIQTEAKFLSQIQSNKKDSNQSKLFFYAHIKFS